MKRIEFITELSRRLYKLPKEEFDSVISYYDEIFLDAGLDKEEETAEKLGNIDDIARQILADNNIDPDGTPEFFMDKAHLENNNSYQSNNNVSNYAGNQRSGMSVGAKLLLAVVTFLIWLPILIVIVSLAFALVVAVAAIAFAFAVSGVVCIAVGIVTLFIAPPVGIITLGTGLVFLGLFGLVASPVFKSLFRAARNVLNNIFGIFHNIIDRRRAA